MISIRSLTQSPAIASPQVTAADIVAPAGVAASAAGANTARGHGGGDRNPTDKVGGHGSAEPCKREQVFDDFPAGGKLRWA